MINITLEELTNIVSKFESPDTSRDGTSKKSNGISAALGKYLDGLSTQSAMDSEIDRLSSEFTQKLSNQ